MADIRPFRALRFDPALDLGPLICPPYDIISPAQQQELHRRSPNNVVRLEFGLEDETQDRYARAAATLRQWLDKGLLGLDEAPAFYVYHQRFSHQGRNYVRRALFARLGLAPWEAGVVRPHERTLGPPKEDRLRLLRATRCNTSPVFALYRDGQGRVAGLLEEAVRSEPLLDATDPEGQRHLLWRADDPSVIIALGQALAGETLYVADGHHRYETALAYCDERRRAQVWTGQEPENFCLVALTAAEDPGLLILPMHRLVASEVPLERALEALLETFDMEVAPSLERLLALMAQGGRFAAAIGLVAAESPDLYLLSLLDREAAARLLPPEAPAVWRSLDVAVAEYGVLDHALGIGGEKTAAGKAVQYTEDAREAYRQVRDGRYRYALLLNSVTPAQMLAVAEAGHRLPQKSTYFHPKIPAGLVMNLLDS